MTHGLPVCFGILLLQQLLVPPSSNFFLPVFSLAFLPNHILPCHSPKQLLYYQWKENIHSIQTDIPQHTHIHNNK